VSLVVQVTGPALIVAAFATSQSAGIGRSSRFYLAADVIGSLALGAGAWLGSQWGFWPWRASGPACRFSACVRHFVAQGGLECDGSGNSPTVSTRRWLRPGGGERVTMDSLIDPREYAALSECTYLNQASLGLIPRTSLAASVRFLNDIAQYGNLRLSDQAEAEVLDALRTAAAELLDVPLVSVAVVGGASEGLSQLAAMLSGPDGEVVLVPSDFPSVTYPWLAARERCGMRIRWVPDIATDDLTLSLVEAIDERTTVVCASAVQYATGSLIDVAAWWRAPEGLAPGSWLT
jgi:Aminotransferase class-V